MNKFHILLGITLTVSAGSGAIYMLNNLNVLNTSTYSDGRIEVSGTGNQFTIHNELLSTCSIPPG